MSSSRFFVNLRHIARPREYTRKQKLHRTFFLTPRSQAAENPESFIHTFKNTSIFKQLADKPEALSALTRLAKVLQDQGIDFSSGKPPSTMQMLRLASNAEFRATAKSVSDELQKAGIDFNSREVMEEIMSLRKPSPGSS